MDWSWTPPFWVGVACTVSVYCNGSLFPAQDVALLEDRIIAALHDRGLSLQRLESDRDELPVDFRFFNLSLRASGDPEHHLGAFAQGVMVGS